MANNFNTDTLSIFHTFSKTQVNGNTAKPQYSSLGNTVNKSGHTVQSNEIWTEEIPFFGKAGDEAAMHSSFSAASRTNDLVKVGTKIYIRNTTPYTEGAAYDTLWTEKTTSVSSLTKGENEQYPTVAGALVDGTYLLNAAGVPVVKYHERALLTPLIADNNAFIDSENQASRLKIDGTWVEQFIGVTDSYVNGSASVCYAPAIYKNVGAAAPMSAGPGSDYLDYCATGTILWDKAVCAGTEVISCFEYVGEKLATSISSIHTELDSINAQLGNGTGENSIGSRLTEVEADIATLTGTGAGSVTNIVNTAIEGLDYVIGATDSNGNLWITQQNGKIISAGVVKAEVNDNGVVADGKGGYFVTADDAVKIATKAANDLEIPEVADATTTSKGIVQISTTEIGGTETDTAVPTVPTVGAVAKSVKTLQGQIETIAGAGLNYHILGDSEELPAPSETHKGIVYLKKNTESEAGEYIEHLCVYDGTTWKWEQIGSTKTDLTDYVKTTDLAGYVKTIKVNGFSNAVTTDTTEIDLGTVVKGFYATNAAGGPGYVANSGSTRVSVQAGGNVDIGVIDATDTAKGLVTLSSTVDASNTGAVTGAGVASAISTAVGAIDTGVTGITVNNGSKQTGDVTLNVVTGFSNSTDLNNIIVSGGDKIDGGSIRVENNEDGTYYLYNVVASSNNRGVTYFYNKNATSLGNDFYATVSEATVKSVYDTLNTAITNKTCVNSINGKSGNITLTAGGNLGNTNHNVNGSSNSNLWGLIVDDRGTSQSIVDGFIGDSGTYGNIGTSYASTASLPTNATKVIGNFVYGSDGKVIDTIRAERMVSGFSARAATGLTEWVADMPNLKNGDSAFNYLGQLTTFIGDLSSLENGSQMFYECTALTTFIGDLSSLSGGYGMFANVSQTQKSCKLNSESVECILESIPDWTGDSSTHKLDIGVSTVITAESDVRQSVKDITGVELTATVGNTQDITYKGWTITFYVSE